MTTAISSGILVRCRPRRFYLDRVSRAWRDESTGVFAISRDEWAREESRAPNDKMFLAVKAQTSDSTN